MADLSQTPANVKLKSNGPTGIGFAGEAITQGQPVYISSNSWYRCDANDTAAKAAVGAIALTPAATSGYFVYGLPGCDIDLGATLTVGVDYVVSTTVGAIAPSTDLVSTNYISSLGVASAAGTLQFRPRVTGVQKP